MKKKLNILQNKKNILRISIIILIIILLILILYKSIIKKNPIKIGLSCTLTGPSTTPLLYIRDAAILAVEEINKKGGINKRKVELIIKDDKFDPEVALRVDQELIDEGVVAILGHIYSPLVINTVPLMNEKNILMISASVMSDKLTGIDDNLIRIRTPLDKDSEATAQITYNKLNLKKMTIAYDLINPELTFATFNYFKKEFKKLGGKISTGISFNSRKNFLAPEITKQIMESDSEGVYIISNAIHAALICQHLKMQKSQKKIIAHEWAFSDQDFIKNGGLAVENVLCIGNYYANSDDEKFLAFKQNYFNRFKKNIVGGARLSYESAYILFYALSKTNDPKKIKGIILKQNIFEVLDGKVILDNYGDPIRKLYLMKIQNGNYECIDEIGIEELLKNEN